MPVCIYIFKLNLVYIRAYNFCMDNGKWSSSTKWPHIFWIRLYMSHRDVLYCLDIPQLPLVGRGTEGGRTRSRGDSGEVAIAILVGLYIWETFGFWTFKSSESFCFGIIFWLFLVFVSWWDVDGRWTTKTL